MLKALPDLIKNFNKEHGHYSNKTSFKGESFDFLNLIDSWSEIVGERLAKHTIPLKNNSGYLTILTNHSAFSQQLSFMDDVIKTKIIKRFPALTGKIKKITFQTSSSHFDQKTETLNKRVKKSTEKVEIPHKYSPLYKKLYAEALEQFNEIHDAELKEQFISIYIQQESSKNT